MVMMKKKIKGIDWREEHARYQADNSVNKKGYTTIENKGNYHRYISYKRN